MPKILLVDEEEHITNLISEELNEAGFRVVTARGDGRLLAEIEVEKPDLVILEMVDSYGLHILQDIRNHFCDLPVVIAAELVATGIGESQVEQAVNGLVSAVSNSLQSSDKITPLGFGIFGS
jgi:DNA-binding NtrC family response regulator